MEFVIIFCLFLFSGLAWYRLDWAMLVLVAGLPSYLSRFSIWGIPGNLLEAMLGIAFLVWVIRHTRFVGFLKRDYKFRDLKRDRLGRLHYPFGWELILVLVVALFAAGVAGFKLDALGSWRAYFLEPALFFILVLNFFQTWREQKKLIWALSVSALVLSIYAIIQKFTGWGIANEIWRAETTRRVTSVFPYPNALALYLAPLSFIFLAYLSILAGKFRDLGVRGFGIGNYARSLLLGLVVLLSLVSIYWARSEGALIAWGVAVLVFFWFLKGRWRWFASGIIVGVAVFLVFNPAPRSYLMEKASLTDLSGEIRKQQWRETWQMLQDDRLLVGSGLHNYKQAIRPYHQEGIFFNKNDDPDFRRKIVLFDEEYKSKFWQPVEIYLYPHNIFLNFWTELGIVGLLLFIWIMGKFFYLGIRNFKLSSSNSSNKDMNCLNSGLMAAMIVILVHGLVDVPYFKNDLALIFWLLVALMSLLAIKLRPDAYKINKADYDQ